MQRLPENPLISPGDLQPTRSDLRVLCTLNPGAVRFGDEILMLVRVGEATLEEKDWLSAVYFDPEIGDTKVLRVRKDDPKTIAGDNRGFIFDGSPMLTSMSHLRVARSRDGKKFTFDPQPLVYPATPYETYGCEDVRITLLDNRYYLTYTAVSQNGITVGLAVTDDFLSVERLGIIFQPTQKDVCIFPEKIRGKYVCRNRPEGAFTGPSIWTSYSPDLIHWGEYHCTLKPTSGTWEGARVGCGAPPIKTEDGWLEIYHAADESGRYSLGAMLSDLDHPEQIIRRSARPVFEPEAPYELTGVYGNCVFCNGLVTDNDGIITIYYGAADSICAGAVTTLAEMIDAAKKG